jgi:hypothetical protein
LDLSATLEPDADHDGFGDETQDQCPTNASTQGACPVIASHTHQEEVQEAQEAPLGGISQEEEVQEEEARLDRKLLRTLIGV